MIGPLVLSLAFAQPQEVTPEEALESGVRWLIENQEPNGAFGSHRSPRPIEVFCSPPGSQQAFRIGTTGLSLCALLRAPVERDEAWQQAVDRGYEHLLEFYDVKRQSGIEHYNVWAFGYGLQAIGERLQGGAPEDQTDALRAAAEHLVRKVGDYQALDGGWGYLSLFGYQTHPPAATSMSFTTATILIGLERVQQAGIDVPQETIDRAVRSIERCRTPRGDYTYGPLWSRTGGGGTLDEAGPACRTPVCLEAIRRCGVSVETQEFERALRVLCIDQARFQELSLYRPIPHESWYQISGYFYLYGYAYAAETLHHLSGRNRDRFADALVDCVMVTRQPDGSFWDYPLYSYHKPYGTAFAVIALSEVEALSRRR